VIGTPEALSHTDSVHICDVLQNIRLQYAPASIQIAKPSPFPSGIRNHYLQFPLLVDWILESGPCEERWALKRARCKARE
jgi:hypothetical protein